ncbi:hypothetical protein KEM52_002216 [Ascosphaera acerosa]|nr:hypothetical protein KEM52_002216 [Ascosphaera acerosa]
MAALTPRLAGCHRQLLRAAAATPSPLHGYTARRLASTGAGAVKSTGLPYVDNDINGGYVNPPQEKRQFRDPHGDWWDKQDRRNFGEPVHEDNDVLTVFSTEQYTHYKPPKAFFLFGCAAAVFASACGVLAVLAPEPHFMPRTWEDGLERELGGKQAWTASLAAPDSLLRSCVTSANRRLPLGQETRQ